jgi:hypothetical protein
MSRITFNCPSCHRRLKAPGSMADKKVHCPNCKQAVTVPHAVAQETPQAPESKTERPDDEYHLQSSPPASEPSAGIEHKTETAKQASTSSLKPPSGENADSSGADKHDRKARSLAWYALSGILCLIPGFTTLPFVLSLSKERSSSFAGGVTLMVLYFVGIAWISSVISGLICSRTLARRDGIASFASVFLANSAGWACLFLTFPSFNFFNSGAVGLGLPDPLHLLVNWLIALITWPAIFIGGVGLLITWGTIKAAKE